MTKYRYKLAKNSGNKQVVVDENFTKKRFFRKLKKKGHH